MSKFSGVPRQPVLLLIMDGVGVNPGKQDNAVYEADTPCLDNYFSHYPHTVLNASGAAVGLPDGQMGNSEVGHMTLGSGQILHQDMVRICDAIKSSDFFSNPVLLQTLNKAKIQNRPVHLLGLVSSGGVHSHKEHLFALIEACRLYGVKPLLHMISDGRDTPPQSARDQLPEIEERLKLAGGAIASLCGRFYAMDRDQRWERTKLAWRALIKGEGDEFASCELALESAYKEGFGDEFIRPALFPSFETILDSDVCIFFNFRKDRPRQLVSALSVEGFNGFERGASARPEVTCMMPYDPVNQLPYLFDSERPEITLAQILSEQGVQQLHCAETEKYPHVTYFFNGGRDEPYPGEHRIMIPSPKVETYDLKPQMSAPEVADAIIKAIASEQYGFMVVNFANGDMVGHTAKRHAVLAAVTALDTQVGRVLDAARQANYSVVVTADHGNCEEMVSPVSGEPNTQHTTYPVPCLIMDRQNWKLSCQSGLASIAPTVLQLMGIKIPQHMKYDSLLLESYPDINMKNKKIGDDVFQGAA